MPALKQRAHSNARRAAHPLAPRSRRQTQRVRKADRVRAHNQRRKWSLAQRRLWWNSLDGLLAPPQLPLPADKVPEQDIPQAKIQAIEAMQEFGVLVEASRASGLGRFQLDNMLRRTSSDQEFVAQMKKARRECQERLEGAFIQRGMQKGGDLAGIFYQKHNWKKYREVSRLELTGAGGGPITYGEIGKVEILKRLANIERAGLDGKQEIVIGGSTGSEGPRQLPAGSGLELVKGADETKVRRATKRSARDSRR